MHEHILIVDDDPAVHEVARAYLEREGYVVESAMTGRDGLALVGFRDVDVVVVDLLLPDLTGDSVLEELRRRSSIPVLMLSGAAGTDDRVRALTLGADDYLTKPFSPRELVARVEAILRRGGREARRPDRRSFGNGFLVIDVARHEVQVAGAPRRLTSTEFTLLTVLAGRSGRVYSRAELASRLHDDSVASERAVDSHVANIRAKLEEDPAHPRVIETVRGFGYRLGITPD